MDREKREQEKRKAKVKPAVWSEYRLPFGMRETSTSKALLLIGLSLIIALFIAPSYTVTSPTYQIGDVADRNVKAKRDFLIEDEETTFRKREEAARQAPLVYDLDESVSEEAVKKLKKAFESIREFLSTEIMRPEVMSPDRAVESGSGSRTSSLPKLSEVSEKVTGKREEIEKILGFKISDEVFWNLLKMDSTKNFENKVVSLLESSFGQGILSNKALLQEVQDRNLVIVKTESQEEYLIPPPYHYQDIEEARKFARIQALEQGEGPKEILAISVLVSNLLQPNITFNRDETELRRKHAEALVKPAYIQVKRNEMLVREGQKIGPEELLRLKAHVQRRPNGHRLLIFLTIFLFSALSISIVTQVSKLHLPSYRMEMQDLIFLGILLVLLLALSRFTMWIADVAGDNSPLLYGKTLIYATPLTAGAMMASIFFGVTVALIFSLCLTLFAGMLFGGDFSLYFYFMLGSFVAAHGATPCRNRMIPIKAGLLVGSANVILILLNVLLQDQWILLKILLETSFGFFGGVFSGFLVAGLTPLAEMGFGYTTDTRLLELATMDQPLLQELMVQAPGTYHHSIIVGNMVEAAAKSIGANALLAKVAAYYHDIGKIKKSLYFIENQLECQNRHEKLAPSMSSLILISHVKEGVELARKNRLGKDIIDIISQHHGTSSISFFYKKAQEAREKAQQGKGAELPPINIDDYRYPGPKPQTKEAGLVMLADIVEAACRSLTEPTPARIKGMVHRLINNVFSDGQLEECELTLKNLHQIARHFNQILATVHHKRVEYPALSAGEARGKADVSDPGQRESKQDRDRSAANRESGKENLKRLGLH